MKIEELFKEFVNNLYMDDSKYNEMIYLFASDKESQEFLIDYALSLDIGDKLILAIRGIINEVYGLYGDVYRIEFQSLYSCFLEQMFSSALYEYSSCYKFSNLLIKIKGDKSVVYKDILTHMNPDEIITTQIAVCSMYGLEMKSAYKNKVFMNEFLKKIVSTLQKNRDNMQLIKDFKHFMVEPLKYYGYDNELAWFNEYI